jgi:hypothetical protein
MKVVIDGNAIIEHQKLLSRSSTVQLEDFEMTSTVVFGIVGIIVAVTGVCIALAQLRRTRRVQHVYELA